MITGGIQTGANVGDLSGHTGAEVDLKVGYLVGFCFGVGGKVGFLDGFGVFEGENVGNSVFK